jgi:hypothetical protein
LPSAFSGWWAKARELSWDFFLRWLERAKTVISVLWVTARLIHEGTLAVRAIAA